jgi:hypothetical protein
MGQIGSYPYGIKITLVNMANRGSGGLQEDGYEDDE